MSWVDVAAVRGIAGRALGDRTPLIVEPVDDSISTTVFRLCRNEEVFYLRVLPEVGDSFAPEAHVHAVLRQRGVRVPEVIYLEDCNEWLQRSVMVTTEIPGRSVSHLPLDGAQRVLRQAGCELAIINSVPVAGFGWIKRDRGDVTRLEAEQTSNRAFMLEDLDRHLSALHGAVLTAHDVTTVYNLIRQHPEWLDVEQAHLAHGDFDVTHIYQAEGQYTGIIDFGEIRGTSSFYDLGHFRLHDGETADHPSPPSLLAGYQEVAALPPDHEPQITFTSLLIGIRFLARGLLKLTAHELSSHAQSHASASILKDLELLRRRSK